MGVPADGSESRSASDQLHGWKEIASYIGKSVRQAQRWERYGLPVHRVGGLDGVVYAFCSEIDAWRASGEPSAQGDGHTEAPGAVQAAGESTEALTGRTVDEASRDREQPSAATSGKIRWRGRALMPLTVAIFIIIVAAARFEGLLSAPPVTIVLWSKSHGIQGDSFTFKAHGGDLSTRSAFRWTRAPNGRSALISPPVDRGVDGQFVWVFTTDCQTLAGTHEIGLADDRADLLTRRIAIDVAPNSQCDGDVPDLVAELVTLDSQAVAAGGSVVARFTIRNQGSHGAFPSTTRLRLSQSAVRSTISDVPIGDVLAPALASGEAASFEHRLTLPESVAPGDYYVWVVADNGSANIESNSPNNFARSGLLRVLATR